MAQIQGEWESQNVCYQDPQYGADIRVQLRGQFLANVPEGVPPDAVSKAIADVATPALAPILSAMPMDQLANQREAIAGQLMPAIAQPLAQSGVQLAGLRVTEEVWNNRSVVEDFTRKAGPVLMLVGVASIVLSFLGLNLKILLWIDAWGATVGWLLRFGVVGLGAALWLLGRALNKD